MASEIEKNFIEPYDFLFYFSPSIPYNFPPDRVPKNLCEEQLLTVIKCYTDHPKSSDQMKRGFDCHKYASEFNECKRRRDMRIFHEIQAWEKSHYESLKPANKSNYIKTLQEEKQELEKLFEAVPASEGFAERRWKIYNDLIQTKWRMGYLEKIF